MALLTLWVSYDDSEHEAVARTTRSLLSGLSTPDLGYLVLHLTGLTRGLVHTIGAETEAGLDVSGALQSLARGIHERGASGREET